MAMSMSYVDATSDRAMGQLEGEDVAPTLSSWHDPVWCPLHANSLRGSPSRSIQLLAPVWFLAMSLQRSNIRPHPKPNEHLSSFPLASPPFWSTCLVSMAGHPLTSSSFCTHSLLLPISTHQCPSSPHPKPSSSYRHSGSHPHRWPWLSEASLVPRLCPWIPAHLTAPPGGF